MSKNDQPDAGSLAGNGSSGNSPPEKAAKEIKQLHGEILRRDKQNTPLAIKIGQRLLEVKKSKYGNNYKRWSQNACDHRL